MIFSWTYFLPIQLIVTVVFLLLGKRREEHPLGWFFPTRLHAATMNAAVLAMCIFYNLEHQLFCQPVPWAAGVLLAFCLAQVALPMLAGRSRWAWLAMPFAGLGWFFMGYLLIFAGSPYLILLLITGLPIALFFWLIRWLQNRLRLPVLQLLLLYACVVFTPFFMLVQLGSFYRSSKAKAQRALLTMPSALLVILGFVTALQMWNVSLKLQAAAWDEPKLQAQLQTHREQEYAELILGAHWKYHTELCLYDGLRPPYHDPRIVVSKWLLYPNERFGLQMELEHQKALYRSLFPSQATQFTCNCAKKDRLF